MKVQVLGAGSAGIHATHSCRRAGADVTVFDIDPDALDRMQYDIYRSRYGAWDPGIELRRTKDKEGDWDLVVVATPPDSHLELAQEVANDWKTKALLLEKPLGRPDLDETLLFRSLCAQAGFKTFIGYNHVLTASAVDFGQKLRELEMGGALQLSVSFSEHWQGIFDAHPWLTGPEDSYLGYMARGGGACCEHSHAINAFQNIARTLRAGRIARVSCEMSIVEEGQLHYDQVAQLNVVTESGLIGSIRQDVITSPPVKQAVCQFSHGQLRWTVNHTSGADAVECFQGTEHEFVEFPKTRPDDFFPQIQHIQRVISGKEDYATSPIRMLYGVETMLVVCAALRSYRTQRSVEIDYQAKTPEQALCDVKHT